MMGCDINDPKGEKYWAATTELIVGLREAEPEWDLVDIVNGAREARAASGGPPLSEDEIETFADIWEILESRKAKAA